MHYCRQLCPYFLPQCNQHGLPVMEIGKDVEKIAAGDELDVNMAAGEIKIVNKGITIQTKPLPEFIQKIADCGGLINYVKGEHQE